MPPHNNARPLIIFDGDDTLWLTTPIYESAKRAFASAVRHLSHSDDYAVRLLDAIDDRNVSVYGFSPERFPLSLVQAYTTLCSTQSLQPDAATSARLHALGQAVFTTPATNAPDATHTLQRLHQVATLALVTKGDPDIQSARLEASGLRGCFDWATVVADKTPERFAKLLAEHDARATNAWSVGNSIRSDVNPALRIGMFAIWIPTPCWQHEDEDLLNSQRLFTCGSLTDAADVIIRETT